MSQKSNRSQYAKASMDSRDNYEEVEEQTASRRSNTTLINTGGGEGTKLAKKQGEAAKDKLRKAKQGTRSKSGGRNKNN